jgi:tripartite ATP-independent transporter DctP family solute receptor
LHDANPLIPTWAAVASTLRHVRTDYHLSSVCRFSTAMIFNCFPSRCTTTHFAIVLGIVFFAGCGSNQPGDGIRRLRIGHVYEVRSPTHRFGVSQLNERLTAAGVNLQVKAFPAAQLGNEAELLEQLVAGEIDLSIAGPSFLAMWHPPLGAFDAAYAFTDLEQMLTVADGELMAPHWEMLRQRFGVRVLGTWAYGARHITANRPIRTPADLSGFRLRMPGAKVWQESGAALGASPMPMSFSEVYMALQQGIADGQENPVPVIYSMGFHEVQKYLILTGHIQSSVQVLVNERTWQTLTERQQNALSESVQSLGAEVLAGIRKQETELLDTWRRDGTMTIVDDCDIEAFRQRSHDYFTKGFPFSDLYRQITDIANDASEQGGLP